MVGEREQSKLDRFLLGLIGLCLIYFGGTKFAPLLFFAFEVQEDNLGRIFLLPCFMGCLAVFYGARILWRVWLRPLFYNQLDAKTKTKRFGVFLALFGIAFIIGGAYLVRLGDNFYFVVLGLGFLASGLLAARGKLLGAYVYALTLVIIVVWSFFNAGSNVRQFLSQIAMPVFLGVYIFFKVRPHLS